MAAPKKTAHKKIQPEKSARNTRRPRVSRRQAMSVAVELIREMDEKPEGRPTASFSLKDTATGSGRVMFHAARVLAEYGAKRPRRQRAAAR